MRRCRACGEATSEPVLDLGSMPPADAFPPAGEPSAGRDAADREAGHPLAMVVCLSCGLAQLADDATVAAEPRGLEPAALRDQAADAVARVVADGWLAQSGAEATVREFGSPHGGSWLPLLTTRGYRDVSDDRPADVVLDSFGMMHEPDQRAAAARRAGATAPAGVALMQFHSLGAIVAQRQWNALRHGHFAYYSLTALTRLLGTAGLYPRTLWNFDLYGGTVLLACTRTEQPPDERVRSVLVDEARLGLDQPSALAPLQRSVSEHVDSLRGWLLAEAAAGRRVYAYGAASRAVSLFALAGVDRLLVRAVADGSPAKHGLRMPATDVPIISPTELIAADPDRVLLTLPDLLGEVELAYPELAGRWRLDRPDSEGSSRD